MLPCSSCSTHHQTQAGSYLPHISHSVSSLAVLHEADYSETVSAKAVSKCGLLSYKFCSLTSLKATF